MNSPVKIVTLILGVILLIASFVWSTQVLRFVTKLPAGKVETLYLNHTENNRFGFEDNWSGNIITNSKYVYSSSEISDTSAKIEKDFTVESIDGDVLFNLKHNFLVDRYTHHNLPGGSDINGIAYSDFPPYTRDMDYVWWPGFFGSPFDMKYQGQEVVDGLRVYHFQSQQATLDDTNGYSFLPFVPEKYQVYSSAVIDVFVEPISGTIVNYLDKGVSYYRDDKITRLWDIAQWSNKFTQDTVNKRVIEAKARMNVYSLHKNIIPLILALLGSTLIFYSLYRPVKK